MVVEYSQDWKFNKFADLLCSEENKKKIYQLYKTLDNDKKKTLFIYLSNDNSRKIIEAILGKQGLLTLGGISKILIDEEKIFETQFVFECDNFECEKEIITSNRYLYNKCPSCGNKVKFSNRYNLIETFINLYLNYFDFYLLNDIEKTCYIIRNKYNNKYFIKSSDDSLINWLYIKLKENGCPLDMFLQAFSGGSIKKPQATLLKIIKDSGIIKTIDNINFKPELNPIFREENKKYFNIYTGNECLNVNITAKETDFAIECQNIAELMFNLTGKDEKGVEYLLDVLAMIIQEPYIKTKQLIIFYGEEAAGKGTFYDFVLKPLFEGYITKILGKKLKSNFNGFMSKNLVLVLEEVKADKEEEDTLKELVTEDKILINAKNLPEREENNYLTIFGFSNEQNPISAGKRRGVYFRSRTLGGNTDKAPEFRDKYCKEIPKEFPALLQHLKTRKYNRVQLMKGYETEAKKQVIGQNMSVIERFCEELFNYSDLGKYINSLIQDGDLDVNYDLKKCLHKYNEINYIKAEFLLDLYNLYLKKSRYNVITLNKFSEFWQIMKIDRDNKKSWRRLINPINDRKTQYVNLDLINKEIKKRYDSDE